MSKLQIKAGAQLSFSVERANNSAVSATFIAKFGSTTITDTVDYDSEGVAYFTFSGANTNVVGTYDWQVNENFSNGASPDKYPLLDGGEFPKLYIYPSLSAE